MGNCLLVTVNSARGSVREENGVEVFGFSMWCDRLSVLEKEGWNIVKVEENEENNTTKYFLEKTVIVHWEYCSMTQRADADCDLLIEKGAVGWELVSSVTIVKNGASYVKHFLKRVAKS